MDADDDDRFVEFLDDGRWLPPSHPGETLADEMVARRLSTGELASKLRVAQPVVAEILASQRAVSGEMALRLGRYFGTGAQFWMNMQASYDLAVARETLGATIEQEVEAA